MTERDLVECLRTAIARADGAWVTQPSRLRRRLDEELGGDARRYRAQVHQLVVAAEERIPTRLQRGGWGDGQRDELVDVLVSTRGWTMDASQWAVDTWAAALGIADARPAIPLVSSSDPSPSESSPSARGSSPSPVPSDASQFGPTELPDDGVAEATELPASAPATSQSAPTAQPTRSADLPTRGMKKCTRAAAAFLDRELDVAYDVKAGPTPALLLLALPIGLAAFWMPDLSGVLLVLFVAIILVGRLLWPARILAVSGDQVWLLGSRTHTPRPTAVRAEGRRSDVEFAGGRPFPSVRFAGERVWFQYPITKAAALIPVEPSEGS